ncbi:MAG TPA: peptidoglycan DD-metalloendopeptidase family protein [Anaerolineae bacterium]|nr:peptidoglycan DD-metalloendopeptidase family protein [Anaerolineae bacterium]
MDDRFTVMRKRLSMMVSAISATSLLVLVVLAAPLYALPENPAGSDRADVYRQMGATNAKLKVIGGEVQRAMADLSRKEEEIGDNAAKLNNAKVKLAHLRSTYNKRLVQIYRAGSVAPLRVFLNVTDFSELLVATRMLVIIGEYDARLVKQIARLESEIKMRQARLQVAAIQQKRLVNTLELTKQNLVRVLMKQRNIIAQLPQGNAFATPSSTTTASGFIFPVAPPYTYVDSWGAPRMRGTRYEHAHEGTDIMALPWTNALAVEDGTISKMGNNTLGGISLWLSGDTGNEYYYAHLYGYADGLEVGQHVKAGQVIGYVGDTGNANGTPHLHFEIHPHGGVPIDPYSFLLAMDPMVHTPISTN